MGRAAAAGPSVDSRLLGVRRRRLPVPSRLLVAHVGFYGGVHYGYGYNGLGYEGGRWENGRFLYNTTVNNFGSVRLVNVYSQPVTVPPGAGRASYNGGPAGIR